MKSSGPPLPLFSCLVLAATAAAWVLGLAGDLWVDEIWTVTFASSLRSPAAILTAPSFDNNHPLVTFTAWLLGARRADPVYRLFPFAAGLGAVALMGVLGRRYGERTSRISTVMGGGCFFLFCYSVEARGYAPAAFFSLLCFLSLCRFMEGGPSRNLPLYWISVILGFLSHASFFYAFAGSACCSLASARRRGMPAGKTLARIHAVPALFFTLFLPWLLTRANGGGPVYTLQRVFLDVAAWTLGAPDRFPAGALAGFLLLAAVAAECVRMARDGEPDAVFHAVTIVAAPTVVALAAAAMGTRPVYARYFLVAVPFALVLAARAVDRAASRFGRAGQWGGVALLALYLAGNGFHYLRFLEGRRGRYREAVRFMRAHTEGKEITIGGKNDFPVRMVLGYYYPSGRVEGADIVYVPGVLDVHRPVEWLVSDYPLHVRDDFGGDRLPSADSLVLPSGFTYRLEASFPSGGPSGDSWNVYRLSAIPQ